MPDALAKELISHETGSVTHDVYSKGASVVQALAAISTLPILSVLSTLYAIRELLNALYRSKY